MRQTSRFNTFETNSSSVHCITLYKNNTEPVNYKHRAFGLTYNIPLINDGNFNGNLVEIEDKLSYIYSLSVFLKEWKLYDKLLDTFHNCIFQRPSYWDGDEEVYIDDRRISSFKDCANCDLNHVYFEKEDLKYIYDNLLKIVFESSMEIAYDSTPEPDPEKELEKQIIGG